MPNIRPNLQTGCTRINNKTEMRDEKTPWQCQTKTNPKNQVQLVEPWAQRTWRNLLSKGSRVIVRQERVTFGRYSITPDSWWNKITITPLTRKCNEEVGEKGTELTRKKTQKPTQQRTNVAMTCEGTRMQNPRTIQVKYKSTKTHQSYNQRLKSLNYQTGHDMKQWSQSNNVAILWWATGGIMVSWVKHIAL